MNRRAFSIALVPVAIAAPAHATVYLSVAQAQQHMFPDATGFVERSTPLDSAQRKIVSRASGGTAPKALHIWEAHQGSKLLGWFIADRVLGKHDYISYAVALGPDRRVQSVEILEYRETYGGEIRNPRWRQQFVGKGAGDELELGKSIKNISGATLSCDHVTHGIKALLAAVDLLFAHG